MFKRVTYHSEKKFGSIMEQHKKIEKLANDRREICNGVKGMRNFGNTFYSD